MAIESDVHDVDLANIEITPSERVVDTASEIANEMGMRLKAIRECNGLSQRELAKRAGITNSNISMIEQGLVSPSINSLARVLSGIPMTLAQFFNCDPSELSQIVYDREFLSCNQETHASGAISQYVALDKPRRSIDLSRQVLPPQTELINLSLVAERDLSGYLIAGSIELTAGLHCRSLEAGDGFFICKGQPYRIRNRSAEEAEFVLAAALCA